ncbi:GntR family transcriptional regulator [Microvirga thermotolerans]|uniref:FCD domain-containing protein n=1 Tax=Microvirga thermotolerans TaxID=2651334 RepID=A0A5P9JY82_9HYPH|nr:GntR family transcriptional regulator [Microvirga thermotolerans]QFU17822.1 FCD domain-containing protein [Microvirga thermotolerans]
MDPKLIEQTLREEIERGALPSGTLLKQEELAARFGVSRQPVRRVLERLLVAGILVRRPDRSLAVAGWSRKDAAELVDIRIALETHALRLSLPRLDDAVLRKARRAAEALAEEEDPVEIEELDVLFHRHLYARCGNDRLLRTIDGLRREGRRIYALQPLGGEARAALYTEHRAILSACEAGDGEAAAAALAAHLSGLVKTIVQREEDPS